MKLSLCIASAAGLAAAAGSALAQQTVYFTTGRHTQTYNANAGGNTSTGWSSGYLSAAQPQRWSAIPFTVGAGGATVGEIDVCGFEATTFDTLNWVIWTRAAGNPAPTAVDQLFTGSVPKPPPEDVVAIDASAETGPIGWTRRMVLSSPVALPAGDYYLTVYASNAGAPTTAANFAWFSNPQPDPVYYSPVNTPLYNYNAGGGYAFMWRASTFPVGGFAEYHPTAAVHEATNPAWGPSPQDPNYVWGAAFRLLSAPPSGACCGSDGTCSIQNKTACEQGGGGFVGANTTCGANTCNGACCNLDGTCVVQGPPACSAAGGTFRGFNTTCGTLSPPCDQPGACCMSDGTCQLLAASQCTAANQIYQGNGTACATAGCATTGACCDWNGTCSSLTRAACQGANALYRGDNTACGGANCPTSYDYSGQNGIPILDSAGQDPICGPDAIAEINVTDSYTLAGVDVSVYLIHTWQGDLVISLKHIRPDSTSSTVEMYHRVPFGSGGTYDADNFGGSYAHADMFRSIDSAANYYRSTPDGPVPAGGIANVHGQWKPDGALAPFAGDTSAGTWQLIVKDCGGPGDTGTIETWTLTLQRPSCYPDVNGDGTLDSNDFNSFLIKFLAQDSYADCNSDGTWDSNDFNCLLVKFLAGCS